MRSAARLNNCSACSTRALGGLPFGEPALGVDGELGAAGALAAPDGLAAGGAIGNAADGGADGVGATGALLGAGCANAPDDTVKMSSQTAGHVVERAPRKARSSISVSRLHS